MTQLKKLILKQHDIFQLDELMNQLPKNGKLCLTENNFLYLDIDNNYIHKIYPLLNDTKIKKPDYFDETKQHIGAHITVIYPQESCIITQIDNNLFDFEVTGLFSAELLGKTIFALLIKSEQLIKLRTMHELPEKLQYYNYAIPFHITVGYI